MLPRTTGRPETERRTEAPAGGSVHLRATPNDGEDDAWREGTAHAWDTWKRAVARTEGDIVRLGCAFALFDVLAATTSCFLPSLATGLGLARVACLVVLVPAGLRALAIRHARRPDADLLQAIAVAIGVVAVYVAVRTSLVVRLCAL